jgi:hypothetical protein
VVQWQPWNRFTNGLAGVWIDSGNQQRVCNIPVIYARVIFGKFLIDPIT